MIKASGERTDARTSAHPYKTSQLECENAIRRSFRLLRNQIYPVDFTDVRTPSNDTAPQVTANDSTRLE